MKRQKTRAFRERKEAGRGLFFRSARHRAWHHHHFVPRAVV
jgi:hypothetical protein